MRTKQLFLAVPALCCAALFTAQAQDQTTNPATHELQNRFKSHITYLASPELGGRVPMTAGDTLTVEYIKAQLSGIDGVELLGNGMQEFGFAGLREVNADSTFFKLNGKTLKAGTDYAASPFSESGSFAGEVVYLHEAEVAALDSADRTDQIVLIDFTPSDTISYNDQLFKLAVAAEKAKVAGMLLIQPDLTIPDSKFAISRRLKFAVVTPKTGERLKKQAVIDYKARIENGDREQTKTNNVVVRIAAPEALNPDAECIVIGAHHDHMGQRIIKEDTVYLLGADDNASGIATLIEMARYFASQRDRLQKDIVLVAFGAEERGLVGSRFFAENPLVPFESIKGMFNFDMTGRMQAKTLHIRGIGTFAEAFPTLAAAPNREQLNLNLIMSGTEPTDYASFYRKGIPTLSFSSGRHPDFHSHRDLEEKINYPGMLMIYEFVVPVISRFTLEPGRMTFIGR